MNCHTPRKKYIGQKLAQESICNYGYPSLGEVLHILTDGNIRGMLLLMKEDLD
jgi:hypothetical protein